MNYYSLGEYLGEPQISKQEMAVRDVISATQTLLEIPTEQLKAEIDDIELAHERLSTIIQRITRGTHCV
jgi:hypothetical protein